MLKKVGNNVQEFGENKNAPNLIHIVRNLYNQHGKYLENQEATLIQTSCDSRNPLKLRSFEQN